MTFFDKNDSPAILDLCSGSGIIAVTLKKHFQNAKVTAVEKSDIAYSFLTKNCDQNDADINCINGDLYDVHADFADNSLDLIVSNPPYIITDETKTLQSEVQKEPVLALDGGKDGYDFYRGIIKLYAKKLKNGGIIAFEIGEGQYEYIKELLENSGFSSVAPHLDLGSTIRCVTAIYNS
jgi:release factor glutamine methyltransferase